MSIGIFGTGIGGLTLALSLQQAGVDAVLYTPGRVAALAGGRLPNTVARYGGTIRRERGLGVNHWEGVEQRVQEIAVSAVGAPVMFAGPLSEGGSCVDFRVYLPRLLEDFVARGGAVIEGSTSAEAVTQHAGEHDLLVVASGRAAADGLFPRDADRSVHSSPQRMLCAGLWHGIDQRDPTAIAFSLVPGVGEIFQFPCFSRAGQVSTLLVEAVPGSPLAALHDTSYDDDPGASEALTIELLREYAPVLFARIEPGAFHLTGPLDVVQTALTPTVRQTWCEVAPGRFAVAIGDAWVLNDPITGQGANLASACAAELAALIAADEVYDERFCRHVDQRLWALAEPVCRFTNAFLAPPPPHMLQLLGAATEDQRVASALTRSFADPAALWQAIASPDGAQSFVDRATTSTVTATG